METNNHGSAGLASPAIGLGTAAFTGAYGAVSRNECRKVIGAVLDSGVRLIDTADFYAAGDTERLLGETLSGRRDEALIATHGGQRTAPDGSGTIADGRPAYLGKACAASLRRLRTDRVDLYYLSRIDPRVPVEDSVGKLAELVAAGKIRRIGLCEPSADELRRANTVHPVSAVAVEYSLRHRAAESSVLQVAAELGVTVVAYCPLARGLLGGARYPASPQDRDGLGVMEAEAADLDIGLARLALAWLLDCRRVIAVPGSRSSAHAEMNASAIGIKLSPRTCARLSRLFPP